MSVSKVPIAWYLEWFVMWTPSFVSMVVMPTIEHASLKPSRAHSLASHTLTMVLTMIAVGRPILYRRAPFLVLETQMIRVVEHGNYHIK